MFGSVIALALLGLAQQSTVTAEQFARLMKSQHETLKDFSLTYEGEMVWTGPPSILGQPIERFGDKFQGFDFYRSKDAAELTEIYSRPHTTPAIVSIRKKTHLKGTSQKLSLSPDQKKVNLGVGIVSSKGGGPGGLSGPDSPHALLFFWYFDPLDDPAEKGYRFDGWEEVDGHTCLRVQFNTGRARDPSDKAFLRFWIDLERGGHPLRIETYRDGRLAGRSDQIELQEVAREGGSPVWFPVVGQMEGFEWEGSFYSQPLMRETIAVVHGSVRINQGLDDAVFKLNPPGSASAPEVARREREGAKLSLPDQFDKTDPRPYPRTDPASVRTRLQQQLAEAEKQSKALEAPSVARGSEWSGVVLAQTALGTFGLILAGVGLWWWRRA